MSDPGSIGARLDALPQTRYLRSVMWRIAVGGWFELYDIFMVAYLGPGLVRDGLFHVTTAQAFNPHGFAAFVAAGFAGMFVSTLAFGALGDRYGRLAMFTASLLWYSIATVFMAFANWDAAIIAWRFVAGLGIGIQLITVDTYVSELAPASSRGRWIAFTQMVGYTAIPVVALLAYLLVPHHRFGLSGWRYVALFGALGAAAVWPLRRGLPESPRWLAARGRIEEANAVLARFEAAARVRQSRAEAAQDSAAAICTVRSRGARFGWAALFSPELRTRTLMLVVFNAAQTVAFYGFASWVPLLVAHRGVALVATLRYTLLIALVNPFGPAIAIWAAERWERRSQIALLAVAIAFAGFAFAFSRSALAVVAFGMAVTLLNGWFSSAFHAYQAELFPTTLRATGVGFVYSWSRFSAVFAGFAIAVALARFGLVGVFSVIGGAMALVALVLTLFGQPMNQKRLHTALEEARSPG